MGASTTTSEPDYTEMVSRTRARLLLFDVRVLFFLLGSLIIFGVCAAVLRSSMYAKNPAVGSFGVTFDLCISIPLLYYFSVVRPGKARLLTTLPVFIAGLLVARVMVPSSHHEFLRAIQFLIVPLEIVIVAIIALRFRAAIIASRGEGDPIARFENICAGILGEGIASRVVGSEIAALYLGFFGWRLRAPKPRGIASTTFHQRVGWGSIVTCIIVLIVAESIAVHLFAQQWSAGLAWLLTALDVWGVIWLLGDYHAFRIRPLIVTGDTIELRFGFRWSADIPRSSVLGVERLAPEEAERLRRTRSYLRLSILEEPSYLVRLREPVRIKGVAGLSREVTSIGLGVDDDSVLAVLQNTPPQTETSLRRHTC